MALLNKAKTFTAVALAATAFAALPTVASAKDYRCENKNDEAQVIGGILGAVVGGVVGSEVAQRGDRNEGAVIGAILGAGAGAALGDESVKCFGKNDIVRHRTTTYQQPRRVQTQTVRHTQPRVVTTTYRGYEPHHRGYGDNRRVNKRLNRIERRLDALRHERRELEYRDRYDRSRWIDRRLHEINFEIKDLRSRKRDIRRANNGYGRGHTYRRGY